MSKSATNPDNAHMLDAAVAILKQFVDDFEMVGVPEVRDEWPDLAQTYYRAQSAIEKPVLKEALATLRGLMGNIESAGVRGVEENWPELMSAYRLAKSLLKPNS